MVEALASNGRKSARRRAPTLQVSPTEPPTTPSESSPCLALQKQLADQLVTLRAEFQEAVVSYSVRVQGLLAQAGDLLVEDFGQLGDTEQKRRMRLLRAALDDLAGFDLKPAKGRRRDLKAIEEFATSVCTEIAEW